MNYLQALLAQKLKWWMVGLILAFVVLSATFALSAQAYGVVGTIIAKLSFGGEVYGVIPCTILREKWTWKDKFGKIHEVEIEVCPCTGAINCGCVPYEPPEYYKVRMDPEYGGMLPGEPAYCHPHDLPVFRNGLIPVPMPLGILPKDQILGLAITEFLPIYVGTTDLLPGAIR